MRRNTTTSAYKLYQFFRRSLGRAGHAGQFLIKPEIVLNGNLRVSAGFFEPRRLLRFYRLMEPAGITPPVHEPAGELIHNDNFIILTT